MAKTIVGTHTRYSSLREMVRAMKAGEIPDNVLSTGGAAAFYGLTRQGVMYRGDAGHIRIWSADGIVLVECLADGKRTD